jgi:RNA polymerase sigma-70 factor (ECF subfamily)
MRHIFEGRADAEAHRGSKYRVNSDARIVERVKGGQVDEYAELVARYERLVRAVAWRIVRERHAVDDVAQEAFVAAFESLGSLRNGAKFGPWLLGIVRHHAARVVRHRARAPALVPEADATAVDNSGLSDLSELLLELVERLPERERILVGLKCLQGYSVEEIAEITGRPVGTVTKQLSRAYERLRNWFSRETTS